MSITDTPTPDLAAAIAAGDLRGVRVDRAAGRVVLPVVYCEAPAEGGQRCGSQLARHWYLSGPEGQARPLCLWHAGDAEYHRPGSVRALTVASAAWLPATSDRCRCATPGGQ